MVPALGGGGSSKMKLPALRACFARPLYVGATLLHTRRHGEIHEERVKCSWLRSLRLAKRRVSRSFVLQMKRDPRLHERSEHRGG